MFLLTRGLRRLELGGLLWAPAGLPLALDLLTRMVTRKLIDKKLIIKNIGGVLGHKGLLGHGGSLCWATRYLSHG